MCVCFLGRMRVVNHFKTHQAGQQTVHVFILHIVDIIF